MKEYFLIEISFRFWIRFQFKSLIKDGAAGAFSQTLIFFQMIFFIAFQGQTHVAQLEGNNLGQKYQRHKKHFQTFLELQTFLYSTRAQRSAFLAQKLGQHYQKDYCIACNRACIGLMNGLLNGLLNKNVACLLHINSCAAYMVCVQKIVTMQ